MKYFATKIKVEDLKPGDLFSTANQFYWDHKDSKAVGEKVYIRTNAPCPEEQKGEEIYRIDIIEK